MLAHIPSSKKYMLVGGAGHAAYCMLQGLNYTCEGPGYSSIGAEI